MFTSSSLKGLDIELRKYYSSYLSERTERLLLTLLDSPKLQHEKFDYTRLNLTKLRRLHQKEMLGLMSWYMPEEIRFLVHFELRETWGAESKEVMEVLLTSKDYALTWLIAVQEKWSERDFFGNVLDKKFASIFNQSFDFRRRMTSFVKRYTGYCRGYQESFRSSPSPLPVELQVGTLSFDEELARKSEETLLLSNLLNKVKSEFQRLSAA